MHKVEKQSGDKGWHTNCQTGRVKWREAFGEKNEWGHSYRHGWKRILERRCSLPVADSHQNSNSPKGIQTTGDFYVFLFLAGKDN